MKLFRRRLYFGIRTVKNIAALALYLHSLAPTITMANGAGDSGELASTAYTLGIAHPTGYPLYTLLGYVVSNLPVGEVAWRVNALSALANKEAIPVVPAKNSELCGKTITS